MPTFNERIKSTRKWTAKAKGTIRHAGGGHIVLVGRDTDEYPPDGIEVTITWEREPTREEAVRQVIHDALTNDAHWLGLQVDIHDTGYRTAEGPVDPFTTIAKRVLAIIEEEEEGA